MSNNKVVNQNIKNNTRVKLIDKSNSKLTKNKITDNSKAITNNKIIPKNKNVNKKQKVNRNILPPQEEPTVENGGFLNELETYRPSFFLCSST